MSACDTGGRNTEGCHALSAKCMRVTQCKARWPTFLFHSSLLSTVALSPGVTSIPVRFNRVYSKVTLGILSVVFSPFFIPWIHELDHKVNRADCPYRHNTYILFIALSLWLCRWLHPKALIEMSAFDYLAVNALFTSSLFNATNKTYCWALFFIICGGNQGGGWEQGARTYINETRSECWSPGWEEIWTSLCDRARRRERCTWWMAIKAVTVWMPMHAVNIWTIRVCIKGSVGVV